ncbi:zinc finger, CCHC-type containing protein [Tanacetum coccineum]|uniref:Zinc finger, CCHC-type containing protein n=1 Tax=Tanacetum coccineum TaxID=301880 RepID=A0ABQ4XGK6_9ASTR
MTTSSANNSVFRGFFEKQKLTGPNFIDWHRQLRIVLLIEDKLNYLEQLIPLAPVASEGQLVAPEITAAHTAWTKGSKEIELKTLFAQQAEQELVQTTRDFHSCKQEEKRSVSLYILKMKGYIDNLGHLGHPVSLGLAVSLILISPRKEFDGFMKNYNMHNMGKKVNELHAMLKLHEQTLPKNNASTLHAIRAGKRKNKLVYAPKPKIPPPPKREDPAKDSICYECGETRHWKRNFPQYLSELLKKKKLSLGASNLGYPKETMGYSFYYPPENKVLVARNAEFLENSLITQEASGSLEDLEIIQEEDTHPSIDTSLHHEEDDLEIDKPQSDIIPIRRSTRTRNAPNRMCLYIDAEEHELGDLGEPANYKAALLDPESDKWLNAINVEMQSMKDNKVWDLVDLPPSGKTVGSEWLFKKKTDIDGVVHTYKARLVAKGYTQTPGIDYEETFSHVADVRAC